MVSLLLPYKKFLRNYNIKHLLTTVHHPQTNGKNERVNQALVTRLKCKVNASSTKIPWTKLLDQMFILHERGISDHCLAKFRVQKNVKSGKGPLTPASLLKLVKHFEKTGKLEDRARAGRPCLKEARTSCIAVEMEAIASEAAAGTNSAREAARRLGLPPSSVRNILRRILQLYPYKLQSCHELLPAYTAQS
ncbi:integrase catalytic domain-containing protein [Trichonephila clavipes]|nr:integrase catalytic domain-containing protein [Trichonephila clavipes]